MKLTPFQSRLQPALTCGGFRMEEYWVWCGSVIRGNDKRYYMFASRWPKEYPFYQGYLAASEIVRASSDTPEGPFTFEEVVFSDRGESFWDGRMTHNPFILKYENEYLLFYIGATYPGPTPTAEALHDMNTGRDKGNGILPYWFKNIRIGMARSPSLFGPWERPKRPTLDINPDSWDSSVTTNPTVCLSPKNQIMLYYRSQGKLGLCVATSPNHPFERVGHAPVVDPGEGLIVEDPFVFRMGDHYEMVCKDLTGNITGEFHAAVHLISRDGKNWNLADPVKAWSRSITWDDGSITTQGSIERPFILFEHGKPAWLYAATADGPGAQNGRPGHYYAENTWSMVQPLSVTDQ